MMLGRGLAWFETNCSRAAQPARLPSIQFSTAHYRRSSTWFTGLFSPHLHMTGWHSTSLYYLALFSYIARLSGTHTTSPQLGIKETKFGKKMYSEGVADDHRVERTRNLSPRPLHWSQEPLSSASTDVSGDSGVITQIKATSEILKKEIRELREVNTRVVKENKTLNARLRGVSTISTLLTDSVREKERQQKRLCEQDIVIRTMQNRLRQLGASTSLTLEEDEIVYPSITKASVEEMVSEISRLKGALEDSRVDPDEVASMKQELAEAKQFLKTRNAQVKKLSEELRDMKRAMASSDDEREAMIVQLRAEIDCANKSSSMQESVCQSLSAERESLEQQLQQTSKVCHDMARKLEEFKKRDSTKSASTEEEKNKSVCEVEQLKLQLNEVVLMNTRWQTYNEEQEHKIRSLQGNILELEDKVKYTESNKGYTEEQQKQIDRLLIQAKQKIEFEREEKDKVMADNKALEMSLKQQEDENERLRTLLETGAGPQSRPEDKEQIEFLKAQIQSCTEDFELERGDREKAQDRITQLDTENQYLRDRLAYLQQQQEDRRPYWQRKQTSLQQYQQDYNQRLGHHDLVARGVGGGRDVADAFANDLQIDGHEHTNQNEDDAGFDEIDACMLPPPPAGGAAPAKPKSDSSRHTSEELLECPRCSRSFPGDKHQEFMSHVDICCD